MPCISVGERFFELYFARSLRKSVDMFWAGRLDIQSTGGEVHVEHVGYKLRYFQLLARLHHHARITYRL